MDCFVLGLCVRFYQSTVRVVRSGGRLLKRLEQDSPLRRASYDGLIYVEARVEFNKVLEPAEYTIKNGYPDMELGKACQVLRRQGCTGCTLNYQPLSYL